MTRSSIFNAGPVRVLSFHAEYGCRHTGACCTARWPIPIEADRLNDVRAAIASGRLRPADATATIVLDETPIDAVLAASATGCVFFDPAAARHCRIQASLGHDALPLACRQFPRVSLADPRGISVTLSHYCPTAAALLDSDAPISITTGASAFPDTGEYVGFDADPSVPPLLTQDRLMDWESWWTLEDLAVRLLTDDGQPLANAMDMLGGVVEDLRRWQSSDGALIDAVRAAFARPSRGPSVADPDLLDDVLAAVPPAWRPGTLERRGRPADRVVRRFLAAHAFANWIAHLGTDLRAWLRSIQAARALVDAGCDVREADLLLRHLSDPWVLAETWSRSKDPHR